MNVKVDEAMSKRIIKIISDLGFNARKELRIAVNKTAKKVESTAAKEIQGELATTQKVIKEKIIKSDRKGNAAMSEVIIKKSARIALKKFGAKHVKESKKQTGGVTYRISKTKGRQTLPHAFMGPRSGVSAIKLKGGVYQRAGKKRLPIYQLYGPSPWGVFTKKGMVQPTVKVGKEELEKQIVDRVRFLTLKAKGLLKGNQK